LFAVLANDGIASPEHWLIAFAEVVEDDLRRPLLGRLLGCRGRRFGGRLVSVCRRAAAHPQSRTLFKAVILSMLEKCAKRYAAVRAERLPFCLTSFFVVLGALLRPLQPNLFAFLFVP